MAESRSWIKDMKDGQNICGVFMYNGLSVAKTKTGGDYIKLSIKDRTGGVEAKKWQATAENAQMSSEGFAFVQGRAQIYQGAVQVVIDSLTPHKPAPEEMADLLPHTQKDIGQMFGRVEALLDSLVNPHLKALARSFLSDTRLMADFKAAPAASGMHHAWIGGLLEHTVWMMGQADRMLPFYPNVDRDLVLLGLFIHDIGKTKELTWGTGFGYTLEGHLLGHIILGLELLNEAASRTGGAGWAVAVETHADEFPETLLLALKHILISHHGKLEWGAAKLPASPEAVFVARLDHFDSSVRMASDSAGDRQGDSVWTEHHRGLETKVWRHNPAKDPAYLGPVPESLPVS